MKVLCILFRSLMFSIWGSDVQVKGLNAFRHLLRTWQLQNLEAFPFNTFSFTSAAMVFTYVDCLLTNTAEFTWILEITVIYSTEQNFFHYVP